MVNLESFQINSGVYTRILFRNYFKSTWWKYLLPAVLLLCIGIIDIRFVLLALMYVFLVTPMVFVLALFIHGMTDGSRYSILRKSLRVNEQGLELHFMDDDDVEFRIDEIDWERVYYILPVSDSILIYIKPGKFNIFVIPYSVFANKEQMLAFYDIAKSKMQI